MGSLAAGRRSQTESELARSMERVLQGRQPVEHRVLVEQLVRIGRDRLELGQRPGEAFPETGESFCVASALPDRDARSHVAILPLLSPPPTWPAKRTRCSSSTTTRACECSAASTSSSRATG